MISIRAYIRRVFYMLMDSAMRQYEETRNFFYAFATPLQDKNSHPKYSANKTYYPGDRIDWKFETWEVPDNADTSGGFTGEQPVIDNQVNTGPNGEPYWRPTGVQTLDQIQREFRFFQTFTAQVIYLEHYLNARLNNNGEDPYCDNCYLNGKSAIYLEDISDRDYTFVFRKSTWPLSPSDEIHLHRKFDPNKAYSKDEMISFPKNKGKGIYRANQATSPGESPSTDPAKWDYVKENRYLHRKGYYSVQSHYIVWVPDPVKNSLPSGWWKDVVRKEVERYNLAGRKYEVRSYTP
jgi:hypothetical protein